MDKKARIILILIIADILLFAGAKFLKNFYQPVSIVAPHHNLVKEKRLEFFKIISQKRKRTDSIILLSPDHFSPYQNQILFSDQNWRLSNGLIEYDSKLGSQITSSLIRQNWAVENDHGIFNLMPDIKKTWPQAKVVPILIGQKISFERLNKLSTNINRYCNEDCLLIASVDFSHYLPASLANVHDIKSLDVLSNLNLEASDSVEVDSQQSLYVLMNMAIFKNAFNWQLFSHSNSGEILKTEDGETTSHFFGWYQKGLTKKKASEQIKTFLFASNIDQGKDLESLGERFFYGVDRADFKFQSPYSPSKKIIIEPEQKLPSSVKKEGKILNISLAGNLAVAGYTSSQGTNLIFLPLIKVNNSNYLMKGNEKNEFFKKLFVDLQSEDYIELDRVRGILIY